MRRTLEIIDEAATKIGPKDVRGWELFDKPGAKAAAAALGKDLYSAARWLDKEFKKKPEVDPDDNDKDLKWIGQRVYKAYQKFVEPVQKKYQDLGAYDSEPTFHAKQSLADYARDRIGFSASMAYWID